ncbi:MAG: 50S ribosomal protein L33 [Streptococcus lutetiensis]|nr:50S ribosomal protein L33 [Streptococcus lutetiensis]MDU6893003.1 50S ribosomal protein L33 [Streptococcus lutetiensis]
MAVPARHTSKAKKNKRRTHYKLTAPRLYLTSKNKRNTPDRLQLKKYSPKLRKHVIFTEVK